MTYERTEWFLPACYKLDYRFYEHSIDIWHQVAIHKYTYRTNQNYNRTGATLVDEYFNCDAGPFIGTFDADLEPESSQLNDLTNTKWAINVTSAISIGTLTPKAISFKTNGLSVKTFSIKLHGEGLNFIYELYYGDKKVAEASSANSYKLEWVDEDFKVISITGGPAAPDKELIHWLYRNATRVG